MNMKAQSHAPSHDVVGIGAKPIRLIGKQQLVIRRRRQVDLVQLLDAEGRLALSIEVTKDGPVLQLDGSQLTIRATGDLAIEAEHLKLHGRKGVLLASDQDVDVRAVGDLNSRARIQNITADLGNVNVKANDDVKLQGERIKMNCD
jgi:hypothetical protein